MCCCLAGIHCRVGFPAALGTLREQRAPLVTLQNPVVDSWVGLAHLKLSCDIEYLIWEKLIADSPAQKPVCEPQPTLAQEMGETALPKSEILVLWNPCQLGPSALKAAISFAPRGCFSLCLCNVLNSFIVGNPSCLLYHSVAHCCEIGSAESISSQLQDRWHLSVVREGLLRKGLANASQRTSDLTFPERDADSLDYK